jgi:hypothetical protein
MEYCNYQYNINNNESNFYIFEIKFKTINGDNLTLRRVKMKKEGNLINYDENIQLINFIEVKAYDFNNPNNEIIIKNNVNKIDNNIFSNSQLLLQIHNNNKLVINYKFF